jgi:hypothetical protein
MGKFLLNLAPSEPLALVQELPHFDNMIKLKLLLASSIDLCVHDLITGCNIPRSIDLDICLNCWIFAA